MNAKNPHIVGNGNAILLCSDPPDGSGSADLYLVRLVRKETPESERSNEESEEQAERTTTQDSDE